MSYNYSCLIFDDSTSNEIVKFQSRYFIDRFERNNVLFLNLDLNLYKETKLSCTTLRRPNDFLALKRLRNI